ncbi:hypothetical protein MMC07_002995 [Pseudocyphellaria aurata]|nr:hypothetical protein [Pseudocyphellaria aurata]
MDAKPQRPARATRVFADENVMPSTGAPKMLHQRNKSSPALSSMHHAGGLKAAAKRTAFGDVSNISNLARPSKDDSAIGAKGDYNLAEKVQLEKKTTALLRPAQRPLSVTGLKSLLNNVTNSNHQHAMKQPLPEMQPPAQAVAQTANVRKVLTKRNTTVLKELLQTQPESEVLESHKERPLTVPMAPAHRELVLQQGTKATEGLGKSQPKIQRAISNHPLPLEDRSGTSTVPGSVEDNSALRSDGIYIDNRGEIQLFEYPEESDLVQASLIAANKVIVAPADSKSPTGDAAFNLLLDENLGARQSEPSRDTRLTAVSEPEEYWDEDEEEENYDEDGYVTARSYKSRGDNTTNGATTVVFPKMNQKVKRELAAAKDLIESTRTNEDIDDESWDTTMVAEYGEEIFQYMKDLEIKMLPNAHYMDNQAEIQWSMRSVLMDWMVQVHHRFGLLPETLFLCVNYIDRFLSCKIVSLGKLQLVGATAIFVAAKYEEINCPSVQEIVYMVDGGYTVDEILKAERFMLSMLQFELGWPGPMSFLRRISKADDYDLETRTLAKYFLEVTIMDERFIGSPPSFAAAGAHCLSRMMLRKGNWSPAHVYYSNYTYSQLFNLVVLMVECCENPQKHHCAIYDKYTDKRFKRASQFVENEMKRGFQVMDVAANTLAGVGTQVDSYEFRQIWNQK